MNRYSCRCRCSARLLESTTESNSESTEVCRTPQGKNNVGSRTRRTRGVPGAKMWHSRHQQSYFTLPTTVHEPHTDSHRARVWWNCKPAISTAYTHAHDQDSSAVTRRRMSILIYASFHCLRQFRSHINCGGILFDERGLCHHSPTPVCGVRSHSNGDCRLSRSLISCHPF
ncbi:MAG: hypothetical protein J07HQW1_03305 [Haloquadratum walsbyi J07HQW1]|uniref:Uncharacterized protein n=1 Tax=Haloquadratum walsbyi J07HQW1 TaxID=1238424 RepID=U1N916_9EURY|nr:MAG: hypothetical protein J07HQW1_03305 [Haloquadratum walsbyi J07HQW1]